MKFELVHYFDGPLDRVAYWLMESTEPLIEPADLPNVTECEELDRKDTDTERIIKWKFCAHSDIPKALQHLIKPEMLTWIHDSVFDKKAKVDTFKITPFYFKNVFSCSGSASFSPDGNRTKRIIKGDVRLKIPIVGAIFEDQVVKKLKENITEEYKVTSKNVAEKIAAES